MTESRSIREYTEQEISPAVKEQILLAGCAALTGGNQHPYTIWDITDHSIQSQLAELCDHQPFIARAKMVLVFCADFVKWYDAYQESGADPRDPGIADLFIGIVDAMIAAQKCIIAQNTYPIMDDEYRKKLFEQKADQRNYEEWISMMCQRKHNAQFHTEMNRSILEYMKYDGIRQD